MRVAQKIQAIMAEETAPATNNIDIICTLPFRSGVTVGANLGTGYQASTMFR